jgi:hypothetical protein
VQVAVNVSHAAINGSLWLVAILMEGNPARTFYYAKALLADKAGMQWPSIEFFGSAAGSSRKLMIVSSKQPATTWLTRNRAQDGNAQWDPHRDKPPSGMKRISSTREVTITC